MRTFGEKEVRGHAWVETRFRARAGIEGEHGSMTAYCLDLDLPTEVSARA